MCCLFCSTNLLGLQTGSSKARHEPTIEPEQSDKSKINSIICDIVQGVRSGDAMRIIRHCPSREIGSKIDMLNTVIGQDKKIFSPVIKVFDIDSIQISVGVDTAIATCIISEANGTKSNVSIRFYKDYRTWYIEQSDEIIKKITSFLAINGILSKRIKENGTTSSFENPLQKTKSVNATTIIISSIDIVESQHAFIPSNLINTDKWQVTKSNAIAKCNNPIFTSIDDYEYVPLFDASEKYIEQYHFMLDRSQGRIVYGSTMGNGWAKSYGDGLYEYHFYDARGMRALQFPDGSINVFVAEACQGEIAQLQLNRSTGNLFFVRRIKGPLVSPVDVELEINDVYDNPSAYNIWVADKGLGAIICLNPNGTEKFRINQYIDNGTTYSLTNVKKLCVYYIGLDYWGVALIDANRNSFIFLGVRITNGQLIYSNTGSCEVFLPSSKLMNVTYKYNNIYVIDQNNLIHDFDFVGRYLCSFHRFSSSAAVNKSFFSGIDGVNLLDQPQSISACRFRLNGSTRSTIELGMANDWNDNSGLGMLLPGADVVNFTCTASGQTLFFNYDLTNPCLMEIKIYDNIGTIVASESQTIYDGFYIYSIDCSKYKSGIYTFKVGVTPTWNSNSKYADYQQNPVEVSYRFSTYPLTLTLKNDLAGVEGGHLVYNGNQVNSGFTEVTNSTLPKTLRAYPKITYNGIDYTFTGWSDGVTTSTRTVWLSYSKTYTARYTFLMPPGTPAKFSIETGFATGDNTRNVTIGDLNDDGKLDLVVANSAVSVFLNTTTPGALTPSFSTKTDFTSGGYPGSVAIGDLNCDGKPDLAVASNSSNTLSVLLNTTTSGSSTPSFSAKTDFTTGSYSRSVAIGDLNGDGKPDIAVANTGSNTVSIFLNTTTPGASTPSFLAKTDFAVSSDPYSVAIGDLNYDGKPDLVVASNFSSTVSILLNTTTPLASTPTFSAKTDFATGVGPYSVEISDLNGDGKPDLAVANSGNDKVSVLLNTTTPGALTPSFLAKTDFTTGYCPFYVAIGDLNSDGKPDLSAVSASYQAVSVLLNTTTPGASTPSFSANTDYPIGSGIIFVAIGDLNGDNMPELVVADGGLNKVWVLQNTTYKLVSGNITSNTMWSGNIVVSNNVIVYSGVTLSISPGTTILYVNGASLIVNGTLNAVGTLTSPITFNRNGASGTWAGIVFNSGSSGSLSYCNVKNATTGVNCNGYLPSITYSNVTNNTTGISITLNGTSTNPIAYDTIQNNTSCGISTSYSSFLCHHNIINNNGTYGIYCNNTTNSPLLSPVLYNNKITNHTSGLFCYQSSPYLGLADVVTHRGNVNNKGNNVITQNGTGIQAAYGSNVFLGQGNPGGRYSGYNSIFGNTNYAIYAYNDVNVWADYNWWNGTPNIYQNPSNTVSWLYPLTSNPNPNPMIKSVPNETPIVDNSGQLLKTSSGSFVGVTTSTQFNENPIGDDLVSQVLQLEFQGKTDEAISKYQQIFISERNTPLGRYALRKMNECYWKSNKKTEFDNYVNTSVRSKISKTDELSALLIEFENETFFEDKNYDGMIKNLIGMLKDYQNTEPIYKQALYTLGLLYLNTLNDSSQAVKYFSTLAAKYPNDFLVVSAQYLLGKDLKGGNSIKSVVDESSQKEIPTEFGISNNYPNPFNPTTVLGYQLSMVSNVSLKVYDMLGREVAVLVDGIKEAGYYSVTFNSGKLAGGVYFARFVARFEEGKSFEQTKKMLLMK